MPQLHPKANILIRAARLLTLGVCAMMALQGMVVADEDIVEDPYGINSVPEVARGIGVDSNLGDMIDPNVAFHDEENRFVRIGQYFDDKPIMLSFNYSNCPKLCSVQLENMISTLAKVKFKVGRDFEMVSISIDPLEQAARARESKQKYVRMYNEGESVDGFHFLVGEKEEIKFLADLCGFRYKYVPEQKLYSHPPVFILVSPKGKIVRYIHGLDYDPDTIEKALIETAEGKIGSLLTILALAIGLIPYWLLRKGSKTAAEETKDDGYLIDTQAELNPLS